MNARKSGHRRFSMRENLDMNAPIFNFEARELFLGIDNVKRMKVWR